jgi:hypothetical protein
MSITLDGTLGITTPTYGGTDTSEYLVPVTGFKNRIINGAMAINRRVSSLATNNTQGYFVDRMWGFSSSMACTFSQQSSSGVAGFPYFARAQRNAGQGAGNGYFFGQIIESNNLQDLQGQSITVSFLARAGANYSATSNLLYVIARTGTTADQGLNQLIAGWAGQIDQNVPVTLTTSFQKFTATFALASNMQELSIFFNCPSTGTAGAADYFDITGFQVEQGSTATSFDYRPYGTELALCQRYLPAITFDSQFSGQIASGTIGIFNIPFPVTVRTPPTGLTTSSTSVIERADGGLIATTSVTFRRGGWTTAAINATVASGLTAGQAASFIPSGANILFTGCEL